MAASDQVAAVPININRVQDHLQPRCLWRAASRGAGPKSEARERNNVIRAALRELARGA